MQPSFKTLPGSVLAVDGRSGNPIWNISTYSEIFELNCGNIDINKDGHKDCVGAGRKGSFVAFDPLTGQRLWDPQTGSEKYIEYDWNIYNPLSKLFMMCADYLVLLVNFMHVPTYNLMFP